MAIYGGFVNMEDVPNHWYGEIRWYYTQNAAEGTTTIEADVITKKTSSSTSLVDSGKMTGTLTIGSKSKDFSYTGETTTATTRISKFSATVKHSGSGKLLDCTISCTINAVSSGTTVTMRGNRNIAPTIPRITMSSDFDAIEDIDIGQYVQITWTPKSASYYYKMRLDFEGESIISNPIHPGSTSQYTYRGIKIPTEWITLLPNSVYGVVSLTLTTYTNAACTSQKGAPFIGAFTVSVPTSIIPAITSCSAVMDNSLGSVNSSWGIAVSGHTQVSISAKGEGVYGSTIRSFKVSGAIDATIPLGTMDAYKTGIIRSAGQKVFIVTCTDTRGRVSKEFVTPGITFLEYTRPVISMFLMSKDKSTGSMKPAAKADWTFTSLGGRNTAKATLYYKVSEADDWTTFSTNFPKNKKTVMSSVQYTEMKSYNFKLVVTDTLGQKDEQDGFLSTAEVLLDFMAGGTGLGIGKICEAPGMEVSMDATFFGNVKLRDNAGNIKLLSDYILDIIDPLESITVTLSKNGWSTSVPYKQRVTYAGMTADRNYGPPFITGVTGADAIAAAKEALSCIDGGTTGANYVEFVCYESRPATDVTVTMQGLIMKE